MRRTRDEWERIVARYRKSGLSCHRFSAEEGISEWSLRDWARRIEGQEPSRERATEGFIEVGEPTRPRSPDGSDRRGTRGLVIRLGNGVGIEVRPDTDRDLLGWLVTLLGRAS
jgi:hypothetical protein